MGREKDARITWRVRFVYSALVNGRERQTLFKLAVAGLGRGGAMVR